MKIVVPLDGSPFAENAIPISLSLAGLLESGVELVSVCLDEPLIAEWQIPGDELRASYAEYLKAVIGRVGDTIDVDVTSTILSGRVAETLREHVSSSPDDLVVMSTHGRGPLSRAWLGSVADRLVRHSRVPVLLFRPAQEGPIDLRTPYAFTRIVVALDGSEYAEAGLDWAHRIGAPARATYVLVRAVPPRFAASPYMPYGVKEPQEVAGQEGEDAARYLLDVKTRWSRTGRTIETAVLPGVQPGPGVTTFARKTEADLIVVTTHGRSGLPRLLLGSVADKVIRSATTPVLIVRSPDRAGGPGPGEAT